MPAFVRALSAAWLAARAAAAPLRFDCKDGESGNWTEAKSVYCCEREHKGCPYDCKAAYSNWKAAWSESKKEWCCEHKRLGCQELKLSQQPYDCQKSYWDREDWSHEQKTWCCRNKQLGCFLPTTTSTLAPTTTTAAATSTSTVTTDVEQPKTESPSPSTTTTKTETETETSAQPSAGARQPISAEKPSDDDNETDSVKSCFEDQTTWEPLDMVGQVGKRVADATECQELCANTTGCVHFSFWWIGKNCHLQDAYAVHRSHRLGFISGPWGCWDKVDQSKYVRKADSTIVRKSYKCVELGALYTPLMGLAKHIPEDKEADASEDDEENAIKAVKQCRAYCASTEGCKHFTMVFPGRLCRMAGAGAHKLTSYMGAVSGTPTCWAGEEHDEPYAAEESESRTHTVHDGELNVIMKASLRNGSSIAWRSSHGLSAVLVLFCMVAVVVSGFVLARRLRVASPAYSTAGSAEE